MQMYVLILSEAKYEDPCAGIFYACKCLYEDNPANFIFPWSLTYLYRDLSLHVITKVLKFLKAIDETDSFVL